VREQLEEVQQARAQLASESGLLEQQRQQLAPQLAQVREWEGRSSEVAVREVEVRHRGEAQAALQQQVAERQARLEAAQLQLEQERAQLTEQQSQLALDQQAMQQFR
jgi:membrane-bound ClpP family serine protease